MPVWIVVLKLPAMKYVRSIPPVRYSGERKNISLYLWLEFYFMCLDLDCLRINGLAGLCLVRLFYDTESIHSAKRK